VDRKFFVGSRGWGCQYVLGCRRVRMCVTMLCVTVTVIVMFVSLSLVLVV